MGCDVLVLASSSRELEGVLTNISTPLSIAGETVGVGKVCSAVSTMQALERYRPRMVVLLGYAGALDPELAIGDGVIATKVIQYDLDLRPFGLAIGQTYDAEGKPLSGELPLQTYDLPSFKAVVFGSADRFLVRSYRQEHPELRTVLGLDCADMEGFSVASACRAHGIPLTMIRVVSDDEQGHRPKDYAKFVRNASKTLSRGLQLLLDVPSEKSPTNL
ncbi:MAG: 5'-methylthioadenosine/S-adenosylhomocysteine nucleosidase [Sphaerochaeta sp.]|uniref:5'-methylthioadenosine/S-adenosylhomocysteine nucleosidase n=1 Tax=Sphaerochaeta sp. TaxID=1972642 RepID=UPI002FC9A3AD